MNFKTIQVESASHITTLTFKRSNKANSIIPEFMDELGLATEQLCHDLESRCVIITGNGRAFCSGVDLKVSVEMSTTLAPDALADRLQHWQTVFDNLEDLPQLTIAVINGPVYGAGLEMALACDFRIASTRAFFGMPQVKLGIIPHLGGMTRLTRTVGPAWTKEIVFRGRNFNAMEALRVGLVNRVAEPGDLLGTAQKWAGEFASLPPAAVRAAKQLINAAFELDTISANRTTRDAQAKLLQSDEFRLAVRAAQESEATRE